MAPVHVLKRRLWLAGLVCCLLIVLELWLDRPSPVGGLVPAPAAWLLRLEVKTLLSLILLGMVLYGLWYVYRQQVFIDQALEEERRRIALELHDGVGFQLVQALAQFKGPEDDVRDMRLALEQALIELHAAVDLMQPESFNLIERMAVLRYRIQPTFERRGIELVWRVAGDLDTSWLPPQSTVHVLKIVQEALGNVLRHAQASRVEVLLHPLPGPCGLLLDVRDNGRGTGTVPANAAAGHGLLGMRRRAQWLGGTLQIISRPAVQGTCIRLAVTRQGLTELRRKLRPLPAAMRAVSPRKAAQGLRAIRSRARSWPTQPPAAG